VRLLHGCGGIADISVVAIFHSRDFRLSRSAAIANPPLNTNPRTTTTHIMDLVMTTDAITARCLRRSIRSTWVPARSCA
jgi:hypothetical protein